MLGVTPQRHVRSTPPNAPPPCKWSMPAVLGKTARSGSVRRIVGFGDLHQISAKLEDPRLAMTYLSIIIAWRIQNPFEGFKRARRDRRRNGSLVISASDGHRVRRSNSHATVLFLKPILAPSPGIVSVPYS